MEGWIAAVVIGVVLVVYIVRHRRNETVSGPTYTGANRPTAGYARAASSSPTPAPARATGNVSRAARVPEPTETGEMVYYANDRHNRVDKEYRFNYKKVNGSWRAYILRMPSLEGRDSSGHVTHRLFENGRPYVCWDRNINSLKEMQTVSKLWADNIQEYIATGKRFG